MNSTSNRTRRGSSTARVVAAVTLAAVVAGPNALPLTRAVVNLPLSAAAVVFPHQGVLRRYEQALDSGFIDAGTTVGNVWLYDDLDGPDRHRHEARHADQWALLGPSFPAL